MAKLKKFTVELERTTVTQYEYEISAKSENEAIALAEKRSWSDSGGDVQNENTEVLDCYESDD